MSTVTAFLSSLVGLSLLGCGLQTDVSVGRSQIGRETSDTSVEQDAEPDAGAPPDASTSEPPSCPAICDEAVLRLDGECTGALQAACIDRSARASETCVPSCQAGGCVADCADITAARFFECLQLDDAATCERRALTTGGSCAAECFVEPENGCTAACDLWISATLDRCLAEGGDAQTCEQDASAAQLRCHTACEAPQGCAGECLNKMPPCLALDPVDCEGFIGAQAEACDTSCASPDCWQATEYADAVARCADLGPNVAECIDQAALGFEAADCQCPDACTADQERAVEGCLDGRADPEGCLDAADAAKERCLLGC